MDRIVRTVITCDFRSYIKLVFCIFALSVLFLLITIDPGYATPNTKVHDNLDKNPKNVDCSSCHINKHAQPGNLPDGSKKTTQTNSINPLSIPQSGIQSLSTTTVSGNITLITSLGQNWYQQGIYGPNSYNFTVDKSWGWTFFDEAPPSGFISPFEKMTQRNRIYALLLDSGNNSSPITGALVTANITYWTYDGTNYTNHTNPVQLTEDTSRSGFYTGDFNFYGGTDYYGYDMMWCDGCHLSYYTSNPDSQIGYFPGNYTAIVIARADNKETKSGLSFEVTPWGCEDCHGSGNQHRDNLNQIIDVDMDSACYLCHGVNQLTHDSTDAGNPHQNTAHRNIQCIDCHTNKSLNPQTFSGVTFNQGGVNNASLPQYNFATIQLNSGTHASLACADCHNNLMLSDPQGGYKQDNYTIQNTINNFTPGFASIQQIQDYYIINVTSGEPLNITLNWDGTANIGFYLYPPNFNPRNRTDPLNPDKGDYPYYNGSTFTNKPEYFANSTPMQGKWILEIYGYDLTSSWIGVLQPPINYTIYSTYPIQQKGLPTIPECNRCHNSTATGKAFTMNQISDWNPGFAHVDRNTDGKFDIQCRMCHDASHNITIKGCQNCHTTAPVNHPVSEPAFTQYTQSQCLACHGDPHQVINIGGPDCINCHDTGGISNKTINVALLNSTVHRNLNFNAIVSPELRIDNRICWGCHQSDGTQPVNHPDKTTNPYGCIDCHGRDNDTQPPHVGSGNTYPAPKTGQEIVEGYSLGEAPSGQNMTHNKDTLVGLGAYQPQFADPPDLKFYSRHSNPFAPGGYPGATGGNRNPNHICLDCHSKVVRDQGIMRENNYYNSFNCGVCHGIWGFQLTSHELSVTKCTDCHNGAVGMDQPWIGYPNFHYTYDELIPPDSYGHIADIGRKINSSVHGSLVNDTSTGLPVNSKGCLICHTNANYTITYNGTSAEINISEGSGLHIWNSEPYCTGCHALPGELPLLGPNMPPHNFVPQLVKNDNELCLECHGGQDGHGHTVTRGGGETCIECHGTNYTGASPSVAQTFVNVSAFNESIHQDINATSPATLNNIDCWSCHYNKDMNRSNVKKCGDCHRKPGQWHGNADITTNLTEIW